MPVQAVTEASQLTDLTSELYLPGNISKNCTSDGWSEIFPDFIDVCVYDAPEDEGEVRARGCGHSQSVSRSAHGLVGVIGQIKQSSYVTPAVGIWNCPLVCKFGGWRGWLSPAAWNEPF